MGQFVFVGKGVSKSFRNNDLFNSFKMIIIYKHKSNINQKKLNYCPKKSI